MTKEGFSIGRLLIVDDEKLICEEFRETLEQEGHAVDCALSGQEGLEKIQTHQYSLVFLDSSMPSLDGEKVLQKIRAVSRVPVAFITGFLPESKEKEILQKGAFACMQKPLDLERVKSLIRIVENNGAADLLPGAIPDGPANTPGLGKDSSSKKNGLGST